ncbi:MAG TPA: phosphoglycerate kinase [Mycobacteriales bacterium]
MRTIADLGDLAGRRVLVRSDLNVPLDGGAITDDGRIRAAVPTIAALADAGARVVVCSHLGRPQGRPDPALSLAPVGRRLGELIGRPVAQATDVVGQSARATVAGLRDGDVALLENVRFEPGETRGDDALSDALADLCDAYVDDAFGVLHRSHCSVVGVARRRPHAAGSLVLAEVGVLARLVDGPPHPYVVVLGGAKVSDKLAVLQRLVERADTVIVGGGMCFTFLAAQGRRVGRSLVQDDQRDSCRRLLDRSGRGGGRILLPVDVVAATGVAPDAGHDVVDVEAIPDDRMGVDIGPRSIALFGEAIAEAKTVFWNGPMGVFEMAPFAQGTRGVGAAIADATAAGAFTVVGGGDSAAAVRLLGLGEEGYSHISTGGGASLEFLQGEELPGLAALARDPR